MVKLSYICKNCVCYRCDFKGECHCPDKDTPKRKLIPDGKEECDNFTLYERSVKD